ncbi:hypothetical protein ACQP1K_27220 [Sphaerimonospora sp. CA-214678]|uniref:hypothetical protein n=1 Tax=Sphaerimonospora sp. CA-214678 TaxID=3240029 RepID=UPI003D89D90A
MSVPGPLGAGVCDGLEVQYQPRGPLVYVRDPIDASHGYLRVSLARWSRFVGVIKAGQFVPQREGDVITVTIGDLWNAGLVTASPFLVTSTHTWRIFCKAVRAGAFDVIGTAPAAGQGELPPAGRPGSG